MGKKRVIARLFFFSPSVCALPDSSGFIFPPCILPNVRAGASRRRMRFFSLFPFEGCDERGRSADCFTFLLASAERRHAPVIPSSWFPSSFFFFFSRRRSFPGYDRVSPPLRTTSGAFPPLLSPLFSLESRPRRGLPLLPLPSCRPGILPRLALLFSPMRIHKSRSLLSPSARRRPALFFSFLRSGCSPARDVYPFLSFRAALPKLPVAPLFLRGRSRFLPPSLHVT